MSSSKISKYITGIKDFIFADTFRARLFGLFLLSIVLIFHNISYKYKVVNHHPHIRADKFIWPLGCAKENYQAGDKISSLCGVDKVPDDLIRSYGLLYLREINYFRVGNDLVDFNCYDGNCFVAYIEKNVYYQ
ncbi:hypothetical protein [Novosphingobium sp. FSW06-99]|uniref:hypothetical protein n=1 Tax=Novosphingobium sp. FSW06-99 TaxID=1739113 RepID=UPI0012E3ACD5|nr:hypothetical protein [Novosphingobium sp. FSW06-99]